MALTPVLAIAKNRRKAKPLIIIISVLRAFITYEFSSIAFPNIFSEKLSEFILIFEFLFTFCFSIAQILMIFLSTYYFASIFDINGTFTDLFNFWSQGLIILIAGLVFAIIESPELINILQNSEFSDFNTIIETNSVSKYVKIIINLSEPVFILYGIYAVKHTQQISYLKSIFSIIFPILLFFIFSNLFT